MKRLRSVVLITALCSVGQIPSIASADDCLPHPPSLVVYTPVIDFGHGGLVTVKGDPGTHLRLKARPAAATDEAAFGLVHEGAVDADGRVDLDVSPRVNTEYVVDYDGGGPGDTSADCPNGRAYYSGRAPAAQQGQPRAVIAVRTTLTLRPPVTTTARTFEFSGAANGHGSDLVSLYRTDSSGRPVLTAQTKSTQAGDYSIIRRFSGTGTFAFFVASPSDSINAGSVSNRVRATIKWRLHGLASAGFAACRAVVPVSTQSP